MEFIIDDSPINLYQNKDDFYDYIASNQIKIFDYIEKHNYDLKSFNSIYNLELFNGYTIMNLFTERCNPIGAVLRRYIRNSLEDCASDSREYLLSNPGTLISMEKGGKDNCICEYSKFGEYLLKNNHINLLDVLLDFDDGFDIYPQKRDHYIDKFFEKNRFSQNDLDSFHNDFLSGKNDYKKRSTRLIKELGNGLNEFRFNYSDGIIRFFFLCDNKKIILLNCFIKKTEETDPKELKTAKKLVDDYFK